jgi:hypothetical protein
MVNSKSNAPVLFDPLSAGVLFVYLGFTIYHLPPFVINNLRKTISLETRAPDQRTVNVLL